MSHDPSGGRSAPAESSESGPRVAVVTGGSRGIGKAILERFLERGVRGINVGQYRADLEGVADVIVDFTDPDWEEEVARQIAPLLEAAGPICLVHNAAVLGKDTATGLSRAALRAVLEVNVVAPAALNRLLDHRLVPGSSIVYIGSTLAEIAVPNLASYAVSKHAIVGLMRATCQDLAGRGVHTAAVCPGFTDTATLRAHLGDDEATIAMTAARSAFNRLIDPTEIADVVMFCARSPVVNGAVLHAHLGQRAS